MTPGAGNAQVLTRSSAVCSVTWACSPRCAARSSARFPSRSGSPRPAARLLRLLLPLLRLQFGPELSFQSP
jgi:hypothetical protein